MRALCKKGEQCEFLHEYNLRRMPECHTFARHGTCPNGDDCMYQHLDNFSRRPHCPHYERGFCPLGPICANKHIRKAKICQFYLAGFCPNGRECTEGAHARFPTDLKKPIVKGQEPVVEVEAESFNVDQDSRQDNDGRFDKDDRFGGHKFQKKPWRGNNNKRGGSFKPRGRN
jgi:cleavage and polyadenylation specificity factor subunit 4